MELNHELFEEIQKDLTEDFPEITKIIRTDTNKLKIYATEDTLWKLYETLQNGVSSIEFNAKKDEKHYIEITL